MDDDILDVVTEWDTRSVADGVRGLYELADADFSGAVTDGHAWAFFLNGRAVGVFDGTIDDFEDASLTAHVAPDISLPLLYTMQEGDGETRAQYYTNDTPISTTDETLSAGNFVGYIELSENVLSGDYYVVYYGGRSLPVAFVGNEPQLLTGDEAFERADDEVGIYSVVDAEVNVVDLPERPDDMSAATGTVGGPGTTDATEDAGGDGGPGRGADAETADGGSGSAVVTSETVGADEDAAEATAAAEDGVAPADVDDGEDADWTEPPSATAETDSASGTEVDTEPPSTAESEPTSGTGVDPETASTAESESTSGTGVDPESASAAETDSESGTEVDPESAATAESEPTSGTEADPESASGTDVESAATGSAAESASGTDVEPAATDTESAAATGAESERDASATTTTEPDTGETGAPSGSGPTADPATTAESAPDSRPADADEGTASSAATSPADADADAGTADVTDQSDSGGGGGATTDDRVDRLRRQLEAARAAKDEAEEARHRAESERDEYRAETERLRERVAELEARLDAADSETETEATRVLSADEALSATNLFVRYDDKMDGTLEHAANGTISETELRSNLRLEYHTEFETGGVRVEGQEFDAFLRSTREHRFVRWFLTHVLYQIRGAGTDARSDLSKLYETIERVDRIDFGGDVSVAPDGPGAEMDASARFDVVFRNRMGDALFVATFDDGRDPTSAPTVESLLERAESVSQSNESFAAAFAVTESFFDAGAMETAVEATRGGLFSRSNRRSYVKLSRKLGFHLCLVEARDDDFFLTMPEL